MRSRQLINALPDLITASGHPATVILDPLAVFTTTLKILTLVVAIVFSHNPFAEEYGYVGEIDLDGDGVNDTIESGPMSMFGNGGGPLIVTLSANAATEAKKYLIAANTRFAVESIGPGRPIRLWSYWRLGSGEGTLSSFVFTKSGLVKEDVRIFVGEVETTISSGIIAAIFNDESIFDLKRVSPYRTPPHPTESQWGK